MTVALRKLRSVGLSVLTCEIIETDSENTPCAECCEPGGGRLLQYATQIGVRVRVHDGLFCSKDCHDRWHGLKPKG